MYAEDEEEADDDDSLEDPDQSNDDGLDIENDTMTIHSDGDDSVYGDNNNSFDQEGKFVMKNPSQRQVVRWHI